MPARLSLTDVQRTALLTLPETEEAVVLMSMNYGPLC